MNILAIGAHFDDVELGCGGALAAHVAEGDQVYVYVATVSGFSNQYDKSVRSNEIARAEAEEAMKLLGVKKMFCGEFKTLEVEFEDSLNIEILRLVEQLDIQQVYTHWTGDIHHDHQAVSRASLHSCRHVPRVLMYCSNWYHSPQDFRGSYYIDISDFWDTKEKAIRAHESEMSRTGAKWIKFFQNEAENAGQRIGVEKAEVYEVLKFLK